MGLLSPLAQLRTIVAILAGGAHVEKSASGIDSRLAGVSITCGKMVHTVEVAGISLLSASCSAKACVYAFDRA